MKKQNKDVKKQSELSEQDKERLELLQKAHEKKGRQLRIDAQKGNLEEIDEIRNLINRKGDDPEEKYRLYYNGIRHLLMEYLPKGKEFKEARQLIYDEKNVFLNRGKKKSDNNGIRKSDGRMTYQEFMGEMLDLITKWVSESQNPVDLYEMLYDLNEKHNYGHENYDKTKQESKYQKKLPKK
jgi:hypothetical protein